MPNTRSDLQPAKIYDIKHVVGITVECMFNPFEYSVSKTNSYTEKAKNQSNTPAAEFSKAGPQTLKLELFFDTYESGDDVSLTTNKLWKLMETNVVDQESTTKKASPPEVAFEWGVFCFKAFITNMTQKFTLFKMDGTPVRAKVDVTFSQYTDEDDYPPQNPTSGGGDIERFWPIVSGDRLDAIAYQVYGDATKWPVIAERNKIRDPLALRSGQNLIIPSLGD
jgi:hypothetical protein